MGCLYLSLPAASNGRKGERNKHVNTWRVISWYVAPGGGFEEMKNRIREEGQNRLTVTISPWYCSSSISLTASNFLLAALLPSAHHSFPFFFSSSFSLLLFFIFVSRFLWFALRAFFLSVPPFYLVLFVSDHIVNHFVTKWHLSLRKVWTLCILCQWDETNRTHREIISLSN